MHAPVTPPPIDSDLLLLAYRSGIFPMADTRSDPDVFWVEPRRRGILPLDGFHCSHSLAKVLRRGIFAVTCNAAFGEVIEACAGPRRDGGDTWISDRIEASYRALHAEGHAHSVECWQDGRLVGGLYGVGFDRVFCGESMFSRVPDASKVALAWLVAALRRGGTRLLDCQFITPHLATMGAVEIDEADYLERLRAAQVSTDGLGAAEGDGLGDGAAEGFAAGAPLALPDGFAALLADAAGAGLSSSPGNFIAQSLTQTS
ncbi:leucyl/phenylalanyl-tRNA--protein transferase [Novosphingobium aquiterrae]|uniref:Leucyl/phenylalanyl-tRNA--protein transferase n=1 Tax=Novosphingobium aquiterrae TaxID=624388 RepID=A0ABV6PFE1_9SPHN